MKKTQLKSKSEPMITLINIVFLILIFFLVAGTLYQPDDQDLKFVQTQGLECCINPNALSVGKNGQLFFHGDNIGSIDHYLSGLEPTNKISRVLPDRKLPALELLELVKQLREKGMDKVIVVTQEAEDDF